MRLICAGARAGAHRVLDVQRLELAAGLGDRGLVRLVDRLELRDLALPAKPTKRPASSEQVVATDSLNWQPQRTHRSASSCSACAWAALTARSAAASSSCCEAWQEGPVTENRSPEILCRFRNRRPDYLSEAGMK